MTKKEKADTIERYNEKLTKHGIDPLTLGWNKNRGNLRFKILSSQWNLEGAKILDFGCGFGDLYHFLSQKEKLSIDYLGIDINPKLIEIAQKKHPKARFRVIDLLEEDLNEEFDYAFASGIFNFKLQDNSAFITKSLQRLLFHTTIGLGVNFLSSKVDYELEHAHHANPVKMLSLAYTYTNNIVLRNDYMPYEYTLFLDKKTKINQEKTVFESYLPFL